MLGFSGGFPLLIALFLRLAQCLERFESVTILGFGRLFLCLETRSCDLNAQIWEQMLIERTSQGGEIDCRRLCSSL